MQLRENWQIAAIGLCGLLPVILAGCSAPSKAERLQDAQHALITEVMELQRCLAANGYSSEKCASQRKSYDVDLAAFRATYGR